MATTGARLRAQLFGGTSLSLPASAAPATDALKRSAGEASNGIAPASRAARAQGPRPAHRPHKSSMSRADQLMADKVSSHHRDTLNRQSIQRADGKVKQLQQAYEESMTLSKQLAAKSQSGEHADGERHCRRRCRCLTYFRVMFRRRERPAPRAGGAHAAHHRGPHVPPHSLGTARREDRCR